MDDEKQKKIDSTEFESRKTRFNIQAHLTDKSDITDLRKKLITGFMRDKIDKNSSLYSTEIPMELVLLIYSFHYRLICHFGLRFYYWPYYKTLKCLPDDENDHCGYSVDELFIEPKYSSFKEEIISYKHISMQQYDNTKVKVKNHMVTKTVKKMKAKRDSMIKYDIADGSPMSYSHILSLVLFTDFSQFCVDFKNSFCPISETETLQDVKKRNSNYFWMSKLLREVVEMYGSSGYNEYDYDNDTFSGPFYACSSEQISVAEFNVRICLPMSTSRKLETAKSYAGSKGITLQFNNKGSQYECLRGFDCSFISKCPQESEVLFFGGQYYIKLENIIMINMQNDKDLKKYVSVLGYLDVMLTGGYVKDESMNDSGLMILKELFSYKLGKKTTQLMGNDYIHETFSAFAKRKRQIVLDLDHLSTAKNKNFIGLVMHKMSEGADVKLDHDVSNLFRPELLLIFNNVKTITIKTTDFYGEYCYTLSMIGLLFLIESTSVNEVVVKAVQDEYVGTSWLTQLWMKLSSSLIQRYKQKNYNMSLKTTRNKQGNTEECLHISKIC